MGAENQEADKHQASAARRRQLREAEENSSTIPTVSNFFPLERYYDASDKVLQTFEIAFEKKRLDEAYVYGLRYCTFCVKGLVQHDYYNSSKFAARKVQTKQRVDAVLTKLEQVAEWMDHEETEKEARRQAILKRQEEERCRKERELEELRLKEIERRLAKQKAAFSSFHSHEEAQKSKESVEESAMAKLLRLSQPDLPPTMAPTVEVPKKRVSFQPPAEPDGHTFSLESESLPPPILPPDLKDESSEFPPSSSSSSPSPSEMGTPPSYQEIIAKQSYFGPGAVHSRPSTGKISTPQAPSYESVVKHRKPNNSKNKFSIRKYIAQAAQTYREYLQKGWIQVSVLNTYQGRLTGSTNGCTVISACVVSKHLQGRGITDAEIQAVIDKECVPLLRSIRSKLGLGGGSLIIPSDVHDHMVDHNLLHQHKFVGAAGGNICDPAHVQEVYLMLQGEVGKTQHLKAGATLFFREHVISIVKFPISPTEAVYDMIDSLPMINGRASRTRCNSLKALQVLLEWYTSHKFSDSNITYVERTKWDDSMADFDPRVFQAFVWADLPKPAPDPKAT